MLKLREGTIVALTQCPIWVAGDQEECISGLFVLEEYLPVDHSAYQWESGWVIIPLEFANEEVEDPVTYFVSDINLWPQVNPSSYGEYLRMEREMEFHEEECA